MLPKFGQVGMEPAKGKRTPGDKKAAMEKKRGTLEARKDKEKEKRKGKKEPGMKHPPARS